MPRPNPPRPLSRQIDIAGRLRALRDEADWTRSTVARRATEAGCYMTASTVYKIEKMGRVVYVDEAVALARVFGVGVNDLLSPATDSLGGPGRDPRIESFRCPVCNAEQGQPCVIRRGPAGRVYHLGRQDRYIKS